MPTHTSSSFDDAAPELPTLSCDALCAGVTSAAGLNRDCFCIAIDPHAMRTALASTSNDPELAADLAESHPHLFAPLPVYLSEAHVTRMSEVAAALEVAVALPTYRAAALAWAPSIAQFDPGSPGGLLGLDFHLGPAGPKLIEINTNPGGILLNTLLGRAQRVCMPDRVRPILPAQLAEDAVLDVLRGEWRGQRGDRDLRTIAIVDEAPQAQYLFPEFVLFAQLLRRHGLEAVICDPGQLQRRAGWLEADGRALDLIYNRLTDFALDQPQHQVLRAAYLEGEVALTPHPRAHALYADKRNLTLLGNESFLQDAGCDTHAAAVLASAVPETLLVTPDGRDNLWERRRDYFFKPAAGFGSKASYRGDKLTRRVWEEIAKGVYVAQQIVAPGVRHVSASAPPLKADVRCYAYQGRPLLFAARLYQGQTTNFRTPGGGFAPALTLSPKLD